MKKERQIYEAPEIRAMEFLVERGIAGSTGNLDYDPSQDDFDI